MSKVSEASGFFKSGYNCTQSILGAYGKELGLDTDTAMKLAMPFGGGIAKTGGTCGAVTGALMVLGLKHGTANPKDKSAKTSVYKLAGEFIAKFHARNSSAICIDLIGFDIGKESSPDKMKIIKDTCPKFIKDASEIIEEMI